MTPEVKGRVAADDSDNIEFVKRDFKSTPLTFDLSGVFAAAVDNIDDLDSLFSKFEIAADVTGSDEENCSACSVFEAQHAEADDEFEDTGVQDGECTSDTIPEVSVDDLESFPSTVHPYSSNSPDWYSSDKDLDFVRLEICCPSM